MAESLALALLHHRFLHRKANAVSAVSRTPIGAIRLAPFQGEPFHWMLPGVETLG